MKILNQRTEKSIMTVTILIEPAEFAVALNKAYQDNKEKFPVSGWDDGMAPRQELEWMYGPDVLFDEALDRTIPILYGKFISENQIRQVDRPEITDLSWTDDGGAAFTVRVAVYPEVSLGCYKGLTVTAPAEDPGGEIWMDAVLNEAVRNMRADIPGGMIERKLDALAAEEKMRVNQDAIYNVLADTVEILGKTYRAAGVARPASQIRHEAMDVMLLSMSADQGEPSKERFCRLLTESARQYRDLPPGFDGTLDRIFEERSREKNEMAPEERIDEIFFAYLGSLNITEQEWRAQHRGKAVELVKRDLLLDAVAEAEQIGITEEEKEGEYLRIAEQCGMDVTRVKAAADAEAVKWQLRRDKARQLIFAHCKPAG